MSPWVLMNPWVLMSPWVLTSPWVLMSPSGHDEPLGPSGLHCAPSPLAQLGSVPPEPSPSPAALEGRREALSQCA